MKSVGIINMNSSFYPWAYVCFLLETKYKSSSENREISCKEKDAHSHPQWIYIYCIIRDILKHKSDWPHLVLCDLCKPEPTINASKAALSEASCDLQYSPEQLPFLPTHILINYEHWYKRTQISRLWYNWNMYINMLNMDFTIGYSREYILIQ